MRLLTAYVGLLVMAALSTGCLAGEIRKRTTMQVKPDSIWFQETTRLTHWQELKKSGNSAAVASYQDEVLSQRDACQFLNPLTVKVLGYEPGKHQVNVEMKTPGRMEGTTWWLDDDTLAR
jgi:hypothetical protein